MDRSLDCLPVFTVGISRRSWTRAILWEFERFTPSFSVLDCFEVFLVLRRPASAISFWPHLPHALGFGRRSQPTVLIGIAVH